jgi:cytochrome b6-f complex iron-sulfur subunit
MSGFFIVIAVVAIVVLAAVALLGAVRRRDAGSAVGNLSRETVSRDSKARRETTVDEALVPTTGKEIERSAALARSGAGVATVDAPAAPVAWVPPDPETYDVNRRQFLNRGVIALMGLSLAAFGTAIIGFLWPSSSGGFGSKLKLGKVSDLKADVQKANGFLYKPEGRLWVTIYPATALPKAEGVYTPPVLNSLKAGLAVMYQKCPHLGCRVPNCNSSQWFECPCHGSQYNQAGEKKGGPAPRGMDRFATEVTAGELVVNTGVVIQGPPIGTNTTGQEAEGPHCIGAATGSHSKP